MKVLVVCLGNICRSPTAEAALRAALVDAGLDDVVEVDSAGTGDWHLGAPPDPRMAEAAAEVGIRLEGAARQVVAEELRGADLVLAMDRQNLADLRALAGEEEDVTARIHLFRDFEPGGTGVGADVPDPYYGGPGGFAEVVAIVRSAAEGVVDHIGAELERRAAKGG